MPFPRVAGPLTGNLESDVAIVVALHALDQDLARGRRALALALGPGLIGAAIILFVDALKPPNTPIDAARLASGRIVYEESRGQSFDSPFNCHLGALRSGWRCPCYNVSLVRGFRGKAPDGGLAGGVPQPLPPPTPALWGLP